MLRKLLKYDFAEYRMLLPVYGLSAGLSLVALIMYKCGALASTNPFVVIAMSLELLATFLSILAVMLGSMALVVVNFGKHTVGVQGQIMFTLPVSVDQFLASKLISGLAVMIVSFAYFVGWMFSAFVITDTLSIVGLVFQDVGPFWTSYGSLMLISGVSSILMYYTAVALSGRISQNRVLGSIVAYLGINFVMQIVLVVVIIAGGFSFMLFNESHYDIITTLEGGSLIGGVFLFIDIVVAAFSTGFYFITRRELSKKINLP